MDLVGAFLWWHSRSLTPHRFTSLHLLKEKFHHGPYGSFSPRGNWKKRNVWNELKLQSLHLILSATGTYSFTLMQFIPTLLCTQISPLQVLITYLMLWPKPSFLSISVFDDQTFLKHKLLHISIQWGKGLPCDAQINNGFHMCFSLHPLQTYCLPLSQLPLLVWWLLFLSPLIWIQGVLVDKVPWWQL